MRVQSVTLFKTPLDSNYNNVFDTHDGGRDYQLMLFTYPTISINPTGIRSIQTKGVYTELTIGRKAEDVRQYNYCMIKDDSDESEVNNRKYYFVEQVISLNDNDEGVASCKLKLKYDCFANNIVALSNVSFNDRNFCEKRHIEEYVLNSQNTYMLNDVISDEDTPTVEPQNTGTVYKVLWYKIRVSKEVTAFADLGDDPYEIVIDGCHPISSTSTPIVYIPAYVVEVSGVDVRLSSKFLNGYDLFDEKIRTFAIKNLSGQDEDETIIGVNFTTDKILSVELTYNVPFTYTLHQGGTGEESYVKFIASDLVLEETSSSKIRLYGELSTLKTISGLNATSLFTEQTADEYKANTPQAGRTVYTAVNKDVKAFVKTGNERFDTKTILAGTYVDRTRFQSINDLSTVVSQSDYATKLQEPRLQKYPYKYVEARSSDISIVLLPYNDNNAQSLSTSEYVFTFDMQGENTKLYIKGIEKNNYRLLTNKGQMITTIDSLQYYLQNNGTSMITGAILNSVNSGLQFKKANVNFNPNKFANSAATNAVERMSKLIDVDAATDIANVPSIVATNDLMQDLVLFPTMQIRDKNIIDKCYYEHHYYGDNVQQYFSLRENSHKTFDYVKTSNCNLCFIFNKEEREELEAAYNRGITRWHLDADNKRIGANFKYFNKDLINPTMVEYNKAI